MLDGFPDFAPHRAISLPAGSATNKRASLSGIPEIRRDLFLFNMAIDSKLRGCDFVRLKIAAIYASGLVKERASVEGWMAEPPMLVPSRKPLKFSAIGSLYRAAQSGRSARFKS